MQRFLARSVTFLAAILLCAASARSETVIGVIGDFGVDGPALKAVAALIQSWSPDAIATVGDNNYPSGSAGTIDANIGKYFHEFIGSYVGKFGAGSKDNRFFPSLGNHDWKTKGAKPYLDYFTLPGNERYYDVVVGNLHLFLLDSDPHEPDGVKPTSVQANWLKDRLASSKAPWKIIAFHHPPFSSAWHGSTKDLRWPFEEWGASLVISGHDHAYERFVRGNLTYLVNGLGGNGRYEFGKPVEGSLVRFSKEYGALRLVASDTLLKGVFEAIDGKTIDSFELKISPKSL